MLSGLSLSAPAQTALIAHRSHGGTGRNFRPARSAHNFGSPVKRVPVRIVYLHGGQVVRYTDVWKLSRRAGQPQVDTLDMRQFTGVANLDSALARMRQHYPNVKFEGFDSRKFREAAAAR